MARFHEPVLLKEVVNYLDIKKGEKYIDATVGGGGHSEAILHLGGKLLGIDCDPEAIKAARKYLSSACPATTGEKTQLWFNTSWRLTRGNFKNLKEIAREHHFSKVAGILFDLGVSSHQLDTLGRGFSFALKAPLDMRMDPSLKVTAADLVNGLNKGELDELFKKFSQEHYSRRLAEAIVRARRLKPIETAGELAEVIIRALPSQKRKGRRHPATRVFLALRMVVNDELNNLRVAIPQALELLKTSGRLAVVSFHSGEDRIVKDFFRAAEKRRELKIITPKPICPTVKEVRRNPRSRSAKLRVAEKCPKTNQRN